MLTSIAEFFFDIYGWKRRSLSEHSNLKISQIDSIHFTESHIGDIILLIILAVA